MKMNQLVKTAAVLVALSMGSSALALTATQSATVKKAVTSVAVPEMPAKAAELVVKASKEDREAVAVTAVRAAIYKNRSIAASVVAAVSKVAPDLASAVTLAATQMERDQVSSIASAAIIASPAARVDITASANRALIAAPQTPSIVASSFGTSIVPSVTPTFGGIERGRADDPVIVNVTTSNQPISPTGGNGSGSFTGVGAAPAGASTPVDYTRPRTL
jgi:hypothetical protein